MYDSYAYCIRKIKYLKAENLTFFGGINFRGPPKSIEGFREIAKLSSIKVILMQQSRSEADMQISKI